MRKGAVERRKRRQYSLLIVKGKAYSTNTPKGKNHFPFGGNHTSTEKLLFGIKILKPTEKINNIMTI